VGNPVWAAKLRKWPACSANIRRKSRYNGGFFSLSGP
jgi:hypothetical protein